MIPFIKNPIDRLNLQDFLSLNDILRSLLSRHGCDYNLNGSQLKITANIGSISITANELVYYPILCKLLRKMDCFPVYSTEINLNEIDSVKERGLKSTIKALQALDRTLEDNRHEKSKLDAHVNNLVALYGKHREKPIYKGAKPFYTKHNSRSKKTYSYWINMSGVRYFNELPDTWRNARNKLHALNAREFLREHLEKNSIGYNKYIDPRMQYVKGMVGGIINTPVLIFRCAQNSAYRGRLYYLNLHTNKLTVSLAEAREIAVSYAGENYKIDIFGDDL